MDRTSNRDLRKEFKYLLPLLRKDVQGIEGFNKEYRDEVGTSLRFYLSTESQDGLG